MPIFKIRLISDRTLKFTGDLVRQVVKRSADDRALPVSFHVQLTEEAVVKSEMGNSIGTRYMEEHLMPYLDLMYDLSKYCMVIVEAKPYGGTVHLCLLRGLYSDSYTSPLCSSEFKHDNF